LQFDMKLLRGLPWRPLESACLEQSSDLAVRTRGALPDLAAAADATGPFVPAGVDGVWAMTEPAISRAVVNAAIRYCIGLLRLRPPDGTVIIYDIASIAVTH